MKYFSAHTTGVKISGRLTSYEYFVDNFWFNAADLENQSINEPLRGSHTADVVIVGGGYTGLSAAYHIRQNFPEKKIILLEGACCGYGASGRNGGFCIATDLIRETKKPDPESIQKNLEISFYGQNFIKKMIAEHGDRVRLRRKRDAQCRSERKAGKRTGRVQGETRIVRIGQPST